MTHMLPIPDINLGRCTRCAKCVEGCPESALVMTPQGPAFVHPILCTYCTDCESLCPAAAIRAPLKVIWGTEG